MRYASASDKKAGDLLDSLTRSFRKKEAVQLLNASCWLYLAILDAIKLAPHRIERATLEISG